MVNGGSPDRRSWECAVLVKLQEELRSGNLAVRHSKRFGRLKDYFISDQQWDAARESFFLRSGLPADRNKVPAYLKDRLNKAYDVFLRTEPGNKYATAEDGRWRLSADPSERLAPDAEARLHRLKGWLAMSRLRSAAFSNNASSAGVLSSRLSSWGMKKDSMSANQCPGGISISWKPESVVLSRSSSIALIPALAEARRAPTLKPPRLSCTVLLLFSHGPQTETPTPYGG